MEDNRPLGEKYGKIEDAVDAGDKALPENNENKKEKKVKEPKPPKEKKEKEPKPPKEKKEKEPKPPKEKKVKEPKPPKEKKVKEPKPPKEKKVKEPKPPKEKKVKEPKPPKEKKVKEPKPPKEKKVKEPKPPKEKKPKEPLKAKDYITIAVALVAVVTVAVFVFYKFYDGGQPNTPTEKVKAEENKIAKIQLERNGLDVIHLIQSDIPDVFYGFTADRQLRFYRYQRNQFVPVVSTGSVSTNIDFGNQTLPVKVDYVELGDQIFGIGLFNAKEHSEVYFYNLMVFKLTNLPSAYKEEGKALLLASTSDGAFEKPDVIWTESFTVDLQTGATKRFLSVVNRTIDMNGAGVSNFCMLPTAGYRSKSNAIPFLTAREYSQDESRQDIFVKQGGKESLLVSDVYGKFFLTDGDSIIYMKRTANGFDVIKRTGEAEEVTRSFYGTMAGYMYTDGYIFNPDDGKLYNLLTNEVKTLVGYRMSAEMLKISPDGKYAVMLGTVNSMLDYQIHIFNLETGEYAKFQDKNPSAHADLAFISNNLVIYTAVEPNQGNEYVIFDAAAAC